MIDDDATVFLDFEWSAYPTSLPFSCGIDTSRLVQASKLPKTGRKLFFNDTAYRALHQLL